MQKIFPLLLVAAVLLFATAPVMVAQAPYEATMGLVQRIFYYHVPSAMVMFLAAFICGVASALYLFRNNQPADRLPASFTVLLSDHPTLFSPS
jgi:heme exporter protein C